jgi:hypothetical protein
MLADDLARHDAGLTRHHLLLGTTADGGEMRLPSHDNRILLAGPSASGKSTTATAFMERLAEQHYQFCVIDPEGDYGAFKEAMMLGDHQRGPTVSEVVRLLQDPEKNAIVNLVGLPLADRPTFFMSLLPALQEMRSLTGRPHWLILDEVHHLLPTSWHPAEQTLPQGLDRVLMITVHPDLVSPAILRAVNTVIAVRPVRHHRSETARPGADAVGNRRSVRVATGRTGRARSRPRRSRQDGKDPPQPQVRRGATAPRTQLLLPGAQPGAKSPRPEPDPVHADRGRRR